MRVNLATVIGAALIVLGIVAFTYRGIPYGSKVTTIDPASDRTSVGSRKLIPMSPLGIGLVLASGAVLLAVGSGKSS